MSKLKTFVLITIALLSLFCLTSAALATTYTYDDLGRLKTVIYDNDEKQTFNYDQGGNITSRTSENPKPPLGVIEYPSTGQTVNGSFAGSGWFLDSSPVAKIEVLVDGVVKGQGIYGDQREDVYNDHPIYKNHNSGFHFNLDTGTVTNGDHILTIRVTNKIGFQTVLTKPIYVFNTITVTAPNEGDTVQGGSLVTAPFSTTLPLGGKVNAELYKDGALVKSLWSYSTLAYFPVYAVYWYAGVPTGSGYQIKITNSNDPSCYGFSGRFNVVSPTITVTSPSAGESWQAGTKQTIRWTYSGTPDVDMGNQVYIELYKDGKLVQKIGTTPTGSNHAGSYDWVVPTDLTGTGYQIKVTDLSRWEYIYGVSANISITEPFQAGTITVNAPSSGEVWETYTKKVISWSYSGTIGTNLGAKVNIDLLKDGAYKYTIAYNVDIGSGGSGSYNWLVPWCEGGAGYQVRVTDTVYGVAYTTGSFTIKPTIIIETPNACEVWKAGQSYGINWRAYGNPFGNPADKPGKDVTIELLKNGQPILTITPSATIQSSSGGSYYWQIPTYLAGSDYKIRITSNIDASYFDTSDKEFTIYNIDPPITITDPVKVNDLVIALYKGTNKTIRWKYIGTPGIDIGSNVRIDLLKEWEYHSTIVSSTSIGSGGSGSYDWSIPEEMDSGYYRLKITDLDHSTYFTVSERFYFTYPKPSIKVVTPNGNETLKAGDNTTISWTYTGRPGVNMTNTVRIDLYQANVPVPRTITESTNIGSNGSGTYTWTIPSDLHGTEYFVKVKIINSLGSAYDISDGYFTVKNTQMELFHFDGTLYSTNNKGPVAGNAAVRPMEGRWGGAVAVEPGTTNILTAEQSSFEADPTELHYYGLTGSKDSSIAKDGVASHRYRWNGSTTDPHLSIGRFTLSPNTVYSWQAWVYSEQATYMSPYCFLQEFGGSWRTTAHLGISPVYIPAKTWTRIGGTGTTLSDWIAGQNSRLVLRPSCNSSGSAYNTTDIWIDCLQVEQKGIQTSWVLGGNSRAAGQLSYDVIPSTGDFTVHTVVKPNISWNDKTTGNGSGEPYIENLLTWGNPGIDGFLLRTNRESGTLYLETFAPTEKITKNHSFTGKEWVTVDIIVTGSTANLYLNGTLVGSAAFTRPNTTILSLYRPGYEGGNFGLFDELRVTPYAFSDVEFKEWHKLNSPMGISHELFHFDENLNSTQSLAPSSTNIETAPNYMQGYGWNTVYGAFTGISMTLFYGGSYDSTGQWDFYKRYSGLTNGAAYTWSAEIKPAGCTNLILTRNDSQTWNGATVVNQTNLSQGVWQKVSITWTQTGTETNLHLGKTATPGYSSSEQTAGDIEFRNIRLELAPVCTLRPNEGKWGGAVAVEPGTTNMLTAAQASFEADPTNVYPVGFIGSRDTTHAKDGTASFKYRWDGSYSDPHFVIAGLTLAPNTVYSWQAWVYAEQATYMSPWCFLQEAEGPYRSIAHLGISPVYIPAKTWTKIAGTGTTLSDWIANSRLILRPSCNSSGSAYNTNDIWIDCLQVEQNGGPTSWVPGGSSRASGQLSYSVIPSTGNFTIHTVVKPNIAWNDKTTGNGSSEPYMENILTWGSPGSNGFLLRTYRNSATVFLETYAPTENITKYQSFNGKEWVTVDIVVSGSTAYLYLNGSLVGCDAFTRPNTTILSLYRPGYEGGNFGLFDELRVLPYAASSTEISQNYLINAPFTDPYFYSIGDDNSDMVSSTLPDTVNASQQVTGTITVKNTGFHPWASGHFLRSPWWSTPDFVLSPGESIAPGQSKTFTVNFTAPTTPGTYTYQWRMYNSGVYTFFGEVLTKTITVN